MADPQAQHQDGLLPTPNWVEKTVKIGKLKPFERNPRRISEADFETLKRSIRTVGYHQRVLATPDLRIVGGHQRIQAMKQLGFKEVKVLVPDRAISDAEFRQLLIQDNLPYGEFDYDILGADYDREELIEYGMPEDWLPGAPDFAAAGEEEQGKLDEKVPIECPECGHKFTLKH